MNQFEQKQRSFRAAQDNLVRAAAILCDRPVTDEALASAILLATAGVYRLAKADGKERALAMAVKELKRAKTE